MFNASPHGHDRHVAVLAIAQPFDFDDFIVGNVHNFHVATIYGEVGAHVVECGVDAGD